jgi:hypothetical protein
VEEETATTAFGSDPAFLPLIEIIDTHSYVGERGTKGFAAICSRKVSAIRYGGAFDDVHWVPASQCRQDCLEVGIPDAPTAR